MDPAISFFKDIVMDDSDTSSDSEEIANIVAATACATASFVLSKTSRRKIKRSDTFMTVSVPGFTDREFQENFRVSRQAFQWLYEKLNNKLKNFSYGPERISPKKQILATIWILSTPDSYRSIASRFDMPKSTLWKCFQRVINVMIELGPEVIKWPSAEERREIKDDFFKWGKVPGVVAAIDGTYVPIKAPQENPEVYINRKCFHAITLQAICDHKRRFLDIFVGYPSSVGDLRIFKNSDIFKRICANPGLFFEEKEVMLGDKAYPILKWCIPPYIDRGNLRRKEINFNTQHAKTRQVIERSFALLFGRFRRLKYLDMSKTKLIPDVVLAACILHNICLMFSDTFLDIYGAEGYVNNFEEEQNINPQENEISRREGIQLRDGIANALLENDQQI